jgi:hypothetical protein
MPLNIVEPNLEKVKPELHGFYVKNAKSGKYHLELSDLKSYVEARVSPVENELKLTRENERKLCLNIALRQAGVVDSNYERLMFANIGNRVALDTVDDKRVIRILQADGETPMVGSGPKGLATLDDLVHEAVKSFPSAFKADPSGKGGMPGPVPSKVGKTLTRSEFDKLQPIERSQKMRDGFTLVDDQAVARTANRPAPKPGEKVITREAFDKLSPIARSDKILKEGFKLVD